MTSADDNPYNPFASNTIRLRTDSTTLQVQSGLGQPETAKNSQPEAAKTSTIFQVISGYFKVIRFACALLHNPVSGYVLHRMIVSIFPTWR